ncbi:MAG TPA: hypothetical protein VJY34_25515 [Roseiarcus sp.]|nr:hypothetical protein [Roseiarcus sp.]
MTIEIARASKKAWSDAAPDKWFRIVIIDGAGRRAWTNPIWVDTLD